MVQKELTIIAGVNSLGVPCTVDNDEHKSYFDLLVEHLEATGYNLNTFNFHNIAKNKTWEFNEFFDKEYTSKELKELTGRYFKISKKLYHFPIHPDFERDFYKPVLSADKRTMKASLIKGEAPIFIYSAGANDAFLLFGTNRPNLKTLYNVTLKTPSIIKKIEKGINQNLSLILKLNPSTRMYVLGTYACAKNKYIRELSKPLYKYFNYRLNKICKTYHNVTYVDISDCSEYLAVRDIHPTRSGQEYVFKQLIKKIKL